MVSIAIRAGVVGVLALTCAAMVMISRWTHVTELAERAVVGQLQARRLMKQRMATQSIAQRLHTAKQTMVASSGKEARVLKGEVQKLAAELKQSQKRERELLESPPVPEGAPPEGAHQLGFVTGDRFGNHHYHHDMARTDGTIDPIKEEDREKYWWGREDDDVDEDPYEVRAYGLNPYNYHNYHPSTHYTDERNVYSQGYGNRFGRHYGESMADVGRVNGGRRPLHREVERFGDFFHGKTDGYDWWSGANAKHDNIEDYAWSATHNPVIGDEGSARYRPTFYGDWDGSGKSVEDTHTYMDEGWLSDSEFKSNGAQMLAKQRAATPKQRAEIKSLRAKIAATKKAILAQHVSPGKKVKRVAMTQLAQKSVEAGLKSSYAQLQKAIALAEGSLVKETGAITKQHPKLAAHHTKAKSPKMLKKPQQKLTLREDAAGDTASEALGRAHGCKPEQLIMYPHDDCDPLAETMAPAIQAHQEALASQLDNTLGGVHWTSGDIDPREDVFPTRENHGGYSGMSDISYPAESIYPTMYKPTVGLGPGAWKETMATEAAGNGQATLKAAGNDQATLKQADTAGRETPALKPLSSDGKLAEEPVHSQEWEGEALQANTDVKVADQVMKDALDMPEDSDRSKLLKAANEQYDKARAENEEALRDRAAELQEDAAEDVPKTRATAVATGQVERAAENPLRSAEHRELVEAKKVSQGDSGVEPLIAAQRLVEEEQQVRLNAKILRDKEDAKLERMKSEAAAVKAALGQLLPPHAAASGADVKPGDRGGW